MLSSQTENSKSSNEFKLAVISIVITALLSVITLLINNYYQSANLLKQYVHENQKLAESYNFEMDKALKLETCKSLKEIIKGLSGLQKKDIANFNADATGDEIASYNMALIYLSDEHMKKLREDQNYSEAIIRMIHSATEAYVECLNL